MRPIKFRAWNVENKSWGNFATGEFLNDDKDPYTLKLYDPFADKQIVIFQQYTGLKDKNDKEIYEGDILKAPNKVITQQYVKWDKDKAGFFVHAHNGSANKNFRKALSGSAHLREVIGNIYENKELLTESEE